MSSEPLPFKPRSQGGETLAEQLKQSERIFALLVSSVKDYAIFMVDTQGDILTWNEGAHALTGYTAQEAIGKHVSLFYSPDTLKQKQTLQELEAARTAGRYEDEGFRVRKDGSKFWANVVITPVYDDGELIGYAKVTRDLTERRKADSERSVAERGQQIFQLLVNNVKDYAIFMLDADGDVKTWNEGAERINGYTAEEIIGKHFSTFYTQEAKEIRHPQHELDIAKREGRYEEEGWRVRKDGTMFWASVLITALFDGGQLVGFAKVTRDLTERRKAEQLKEENARIASETNEELQRLAYVVSHELQAPVSTIARYGNLFTVRYKDVLGGDAYEFLDKMTEASKLVARMVDDLWMYARISKPNAIQELVYTGACLKDAISELHDVIGDAQITDTNLPSVEGNKQQLTFLFRELINNAIRYRSTERPDIRIGAQQQNNGWQFFVKDNGIGIDKVRTNEVFQLFHRLRGGPEPSATGMGLAICRKIVQQHHGHIWFDSAPGEGTTFHFWLPERVEDKDVTTSGMHIR